MKRLGLLRHAKSEWGASNQRDFDRGLNERGRKGARLIGAHIQTRDSKFDALIASPAARIKATLEAADIGLAAHFDEKLYLASAETIIEVIEHYGTRLAGGKADAILVAGHNPGLHDTVLRLVSPSHEDALFREAAIKFPTATFALLECDIDDWSQLRNCCAKLAHLARPRDLDPALGPED